MNQQFNNCSFPHVMNKKTSWLLTTVTLCTWKTRFSDAEKEKYRNEPSFEYFQSLDDLRNLWMNLNIRVVLGFEILKGLSLESLEFWIEFKSYKTKIWVTLSQLVHRPSFGTLFDQEYIIEPSYWRYECWLLDCENMPFLTLSTLCTSLGNADLQKNEWTRKHKKRNAKMKLFYT